VKLKYLKLHTPFRGLPAGFEIKFPENKATQNIEPYCLVGLNGSGKSNLLQVLAEMFFTIEKYVIENKDHSFPPKIFVPKLNYSFEIEYENSRDLFFISQEPNSTPAVETFLDDEWISKGNTDWDYLPERIVGYSSGMNELLSNPFIKMDFQYFDEFQEKVKNRSFGAIGVNKMFFMDYESNQLVVLANFLIPNEENDTHLDVLQNELNINDLNSFSVTIRKRQYNGDSIEFPSELNEAIIRLENCATCHFTEKEGKIDVIRLDYWVNEATKLAFRRHFRTSFELFRYLYLLRLLNIHCFSPKLRKKVKDAGLEVNLSAIIPKPESSELVFSINEITLWKKHIEKPIYYKQLSDGEHQLLHVLGAIILFDTDGTLFLLDEPETHFNPEWRSKFVSLMNQVITVKRKQEFIITTHSPFVVSDCKPERVFIFERNKKNEVVYHQPDFNTFGASVNLISLKVFGKKETIAELAMDRLRELKSEVEAGAITVEEAQKAIFNELGDSVEKMLAIDSINKLSQQN
jgi:restriction system-associated AAA family ATPase